MGMFKLFSEGFYFDMFEKNTYLIKDVLKEELKFYKVKEKYHKRKIHYFKNIFSENIFNVTSWR